MFFVKQDLDDWEDVGLNASQPPDLLTLLRDYGQHVADPIKMRNQEVDDLKVSIEKLVRVFNTIHHQIMLFLMEMRCDIIIVVSFVLLRLQRIEF